MYGPAETFENHTDGYIIIVGQTPLPDSGPWQWWVDGDFSATPKNLGEGYRWNTPTLYYAYDESFLDYFGSNGVAAVDAAVAMLNSLTNVSSFSSDLSEFPLDELRYNNTAAALHMFDLKSAALELLIERLGLADSTHWTWCVRAKLNPPSTTCPIYDYEIIQRNFDPVAWLPSSYVNGNLYTYVIEQTCSPDPLGDFSDAVEVLVDPTATYNTAVSTPKIMFPRPIYYGAFHTGLTRDDAGGLRYLYRASNLAVEGAGQNSTVAFTNTFNPQLLYPSNLTLLANQALTNNPATLQVLFPGLQITSTTNFFALVWTTNLSAYFTNFPYDPIDSFPHLVIVTNRTPSIGTFYHHTFANIETIEFTNGAWTGVPITDISSHSGRALLTLETIVSTNPPWATAGSGQVITNTYFKTFATNMITGEFFIVPSNSCGVSFIMPLLTNVVSSTNLITVATNLAGIVNTNPAATNLVFTQSTIDYFTNHIFVVYPVDCQTNSVALREGIEKITFIRRDYDSLIGRYFYPITNQYTLNAITNNQVVPQTVIRPVLQPDIVFSASDLSGPPASFLVPTVQRSAPTFSTNTTPANLAGPGTIEGVMNFAFNKVSGTNIDNGTYPNFVEEVSGVVNFVWASFDSSSRDPIVYPPGTSISNLLNQIIMAAYPPSLPNAASQTAYSFTYTNTASGVAYTNMFSGSGGQLPYVWTLTPGSAALPPNLALASDGTGTVSGTLTQPGTFSFSIRMTDANGRFIDSSYTITVSP